LKLCERAHERSVPTFIIDQGILGRFSDLPSLILSRLEQLNLDGRRLTDCLITHSLKLTLNKIIVFAMIISKTGGKP
jgi:hypothetical protein